MFNVMLTTIEGSYYFTKFNNIKRTRVFHMLLRKNVYLPKKCMTASFFLKLEYDNI